MAYGHEFFNERQRLKTKITFVLIFQEICPF